MLHGPTLMVATLLIASSAVAASPLQDEPPPATQPDDGKPKAKYEKVVIKDVEYKLELALDQPAREKGLMGREKLDDDKGMLFAYPHAGVRNYWMKDCLIDIDIIFLDSMGRVVATHEMKKEEPQGADESYIDFLNRLKRYSSKRPSQYAIELKAGTLKKLKLKPGEVIEFDRRRISHLAK